MKTVKLFLLALFGVLIGAIAYGVIIDRSSPIHIGNITPVDEAEAIQPITKSPIDIEFSNVVDIMDAQQEAIEETGCMYTFRNLSAQTIQNIVNVLLDKRRPLTIRNIVEEYDLHADIYDPIDKTDESVSYSLKDLPPARDNPETISTQTTNDTIKLNP